MNESAEDDFDLTHWKEVCHAHEAELQWTRADNARLRVALTNAAATIGDVYQWLDMVEKAGGATSISGIAKCHAMLASLRKNATRTENLVMVPARAALAGEVKP